MSLLPRITFGMIVLNGEPFVRYNLRALYPFAYEIIVVEGAVRSSKINVTADGHSVDGTLETLQQFKATEDPDNKLIIITRDGFWDEKDAMSQAYAERATGDYLWQIDVDEFYFPDDMQHILTMLHENPEITVISFKPLTFWGRPDVIVDGWYLRRYGDEMRRLFKWGANYRYITHRPPTVYDEQGRDLHNLLSINSRQMEKQRIYLYHYSLLFPQQMIEKAAYRDDADWIVLNRFREWVQESYLKLGNPFQVYYIYDSPSWLSYYRGTQPPQIKDMWQDIEAGKISIKIRPMIDVEQLLQSPQYIMQRQWLVVWDYFHRVYLIRRIWRWFEVRILKPLKQLLHFA